LTFHAYKKYTFNKQRWGPPTPIKISEFEAFKEFIAHDEQTNSTFASMLVGEISAFQEGRYMN